MTQFSSWNLKAGFRYLVCDNIMIDYLDIAENVYFGNGGTNQRFCDI